MMRETTDKSDTTRGKQYPKYHAGLASHVLTSEVDTRSDACPIRRRILEGDSSSLRFRAYRP